MKLVRRGALPVGGESGLLDVRDRAMSGTTGDTGRVRTATVEQYDIWPAYVDRVLSFVDVAAIKPLQGRDRRGERDGRDDAAAGARAAADRGGALLLRARRLVPEPRAEPAPPREPRVHRPQDPRGGRRPRRRVRRRRRPLLLRRRHRRVRPGRLRHRALRRELAREASPARRSSTTCARAAPCPTRSSAPAASPLVNRVGHAFIKARMRKDDAAFAGEVSGHYYFRDFSQADSGVIPFLLMLELISKKGRSCRRSSRRSARATSSPARSTRRSPTSRSSCRS